MNAAHYRLLVVDDNLAIHEDFRKVLAVSSVNASLRQAEAQLFNLPAYSGSTPPPTFDLAFCSQGEEAVEAVRRAKAEQQSFALAFLDVRMPPGMNGIETARQLWAIDPDVQIVVCTAFADFSWTEMAERLGHPDRWVILKKPFDNVEVLQLAHALADKWALRQQTKRHVSDLERTVASRTADLESALQRLRAEVAERERAELERRQIERKLEETQRLESLGVLAGGVAHDFNNILTGILVSASLARIEAAPGSDLSNHLTIIEENSRRAAGLCEQMLTYAGKSPVAQAPLDVNALVRESLELLHVSIPKDADFSIQLVEGLPSVNGDAARLRQVFMNLVLNSAEALGAPPRKIRLASGRLTLDAATLQRIAHPGGAVPGPFVYVEVSDTGVGISAESLTRIFEPFYTTKFTGRGLGLCAVLGIMRSHGGALDVASILGRGTTFRIYLPACTENVVTPSASAPAGEVKMSGTVLVADDEESVRRAAAAVLRRLGLQVLQAQDGAEAVEMAERQGKPLAGLLLDLTMPRLNGIAALAALRKRQPGVPAILMTGYDASEADQKLEPMDEVTVLQKPFSVEELIRQVSERFQRHDR